MQLFWSSLSAVLCLSLLSPALPQEPESTTVKSHLGAPARPVYRSTQLQGDARILHAFNRFAFGPRPGDLEAVRTMGLDKWFEQQLHPSSLDQSDLNARLAQFPAMQWAPEDLLFRVPSNAIIRQTIDRKLPIPERGALHSVYENQIYRVTAKKQEQDLKKSTGVPGDRPTSLGWHNKQDLATTGSPASM